MSWTTGKRAAAIAEIAEVLPQRSSQLGRLLWRQARGPLHRGMASVLATLGNGAETVGRLAEIEGVAQPTMTRMVGRLEAEGLVERRRGEGDARVVLVALTPAGTEELAGLRERYRAVLRDRLAGVPDARLEELLAASEALAGLVESLRQAEG